MKTTKQNLLLEQIDRKIKQFYLLRNLSIPDMGWLRSIRKALNMSLRQFGNRLSITPQSAREIEEREKSGSITLRSLNEAAEALDMHFVYVLIPKDKTLKKVIEKRAYQLAGEIVLRTSHTMKLEDQAISSKRIRKTIKDRAKEIRFKIPRYFWD